MTHNHSKYVTYRLIPMIPSRNMPMINLMPFILRNLSRHVLPVILPAEDIGYFGPILSPLSLDSVDDPRHEVIFVLDDGAPALAVRVVPQAEDVTVVGQDEGVGAARGDGHGLRLCSVSDGKRDAARLD